MYDRATMVEELDREAAILRQRQQAQAPAVAAGVVHDCVDCGEPIPAKRRKAVHGCTRCIVCAKDNERQMKLAHR
nr:TraR/DksA C4-type zinc finger protein [Duganella lactea]